MSSSDWAFIGDVASSATHERGPVTSAVVPVPSGGGSFVYGIHSLTNAAGAVALYSGLSGFTPTSKGGVISGAIHKGGAGGSLHSEFIFAQLNGTGSTNSCYMLGFSASDPSHLILRKGMLTGGLPDVAPGSQGVLRRSSAAFALGTWVHVKLEAILEPNGDVLLNCYASDLGANAVTSPSWAAIAGMGSFTDDHLQVNTGSAPLTGGRMGFGAVMAEINRIAAFDQVVTERQL